MDPINWKALRLNCAGDETLMHEVLALFRTEAKGLLSDVARAVAAKDALEVKRTAHRLKGALVSLAAEHATECARELELCGASGVLNDANVLFGELELAVAQVLGAIRIPRAA
jgi:HPt (histidine-containing phosphotransfer) domain-containing protein